MAERDKATDGTRHVLVLNQHGDNRGDEAAFRAMFAGIAERASGPVRFTVLHQFAGGRVDVRVSHDVRWISLVPTPLEAARISAYAALLALGIRARALLGPWGRSVIDAYEGADVALSAPGGPYFGDPYASHELVHWFYVWLAHRHRLPTMLYAPSVGPFRKRALNPVRRRLFPRFRAIAVREEVSLGYLRALLRGRGPEPVLAMDSALQRPIPPAERASYFTGERTALAHRFLVGVSAIQWSFPGHPDPAGAHARYESALVDALLHVHRERSAHFLLVPQLYGMRHSDVPYLRALAARLPADVSWELVDPAADSDHQQRVFGMCDMYVASRYHPQVFAINAAVPGICIHYQHKALGFIERFGLGRLAFPIDALDRARLLAAVDEVLERRDALSEGIARALPGMRAASARSSELAVALLEGARR